jgi:hypothetical protein
MLVLVLLEIQLKGIDMDVLILMGMDGMMQSMNYLVSSTNGLIKMLMDSETMQLDRNQMLALAYRERQP